MDAVGELLNQIADTLPTSRVELRKLKVAIATQSHAKLIRNDLLLHRYRLEVSQGHRAADTRLERILTLNGIRSQSGIATVTVITEPYACPGRCVYCPTEARAPKSYLTNEPAVMRALRNDYDPYRQVQSRLEALDETGHPIDKVELIIKGGTWSFYPDAYQRLFIQRCFEAANHFIGNQGNCGMRNVECGISSLKSAIQNPQLPSMSSTLTEAQQINETAKNRIIGITIETRPDYITVEEIRRLRVLGVTRVELGVQSLDESVLALTVRDHGTAAIRTATALLKDAGVKVAYHLMPNLPGATPASDLESARLLFVDPGYQPDTMKLYPCVIIESAALYQWWREGRYTPYDDETLIRLLTQIKQLVPPYVRIERVIRDIPSTSIKAGCMVTNLREEIHRRMRRQGLRCRCIRCRQVRGTIAGTFTMHEQRYHASGGTEIFLSFEDAPSNQLASFLRLRIPPAHSEAPPLFPALQGAALVRELHTYGQHVPLQAHEEGAAQHRGFGWQLLQAAERIAREEFGVTRVAVIAGAGVREYYRKLGYALQDTYMVKTL